VLDRARIEFETEFVRWYKTQSSRYLIRGKALRTVSRYRDKYLHGQDAALKAEYFGKCIQRRNLIRGAWAVGLLVLGGSLYVGRRRMDAMLQQRALTSWGLPSDLFSLQDKVDALAIGQSVNDVSWLRSARLQDVDLKYSGENLKGIEELRNLTSLSVEPTGPRIVDWTHLSTMKALKSLTLNLKFQREQTLNGLEGLSNLESLRFAFQYIPSRDLGSFGRSGNLKTLRLDVEQVDLSDLRSWGLDQLTSVRSLTMKAWECQISNLADLVLMPRLESVSLLLGGGRINRWDSIERLPNLKDLMIDLNGTSIPSLRTLTGIEMLRSLTLIWMDNEFGDLKSVNTISGLEKLTIGSVVGVRPQMLRAIDSKIRVNTLYIVTNHAESELIDALVEFDQVRDLGLYLHSAVNQDVRRLRALSNLNSLDLFCTTRVGIDFSALGGRRTLRTLRVRFDGAIGGQGFVGIESLEDLDALDVTLGSSSISSFSGIEQLRKLRRLKLDLHRSNVSDLSILERLHGLDSVDVCIPPALVPHVAELKIPAKQLRVCCRIA
jgi:hypothetical protein